MNIDYSFLEAKAETLKIGTKFQDMSASSLRKFKVGLNVDSSAAPDYNTALKWETQIAEGHLENTLKMSQGAKGRNKLDVMIQEIVSYSFVPGKNSIYTNFKVKIPSNNINYVWYMKHQNTDTYIKSRAFFQYASRKRADLQIMGISVAKKSSGEVKFSYPGREMLLETKMEEVATKTYQATMTAQWQRGKRATATANYADKSSSDELYHELQVDVTHPEKKIKYVGEVKSNRALYMTKNSLTIEQDLYMVNAEYLVPQKKVSAVAFVVGKKYTADASLREESVSLTAFVDIQLDKMRHIKGMATYDWHNQKIGKVNLYWNADKDLAEKIELNVMYNPSNNYASVSLYYPVRTLTATLKPFYQSHGGTMTSKILADFSWESSKKISVDVSFVCKKKLGEMTAAITGRSPFEGYEQMSLKHNHRLNSNSIMAKTSIKVGQSYFLNVDFTSSMQTGHTNAYNADLQVRSSVDYYETLGITLDHASSESQFRTNASVSWGNYKKITLLTSGVDSSDYYKTDIRGEFDLKTPFDNYNVLSGNINHKYQTNHITSTGNLKWARDQEVSINIGGSQMKNGKNNICKATVRINTPFRDYYNMQSTVNYEFDGEKRKTDVEVQWPSKKLNFGFDGSHKSTKYSTKCDVNMYFKSPYNGYKDVSLSANYHREQSMFESNAKLILDMPTQWAIETNAKYQSWDNFEVEGTIETPNSMYKKMEGKMTHKKTESQVNTYIEGIINSRKSSADLTVKYENDNRKVLDWKVVCTTPLEEYSKVVLSGKHQYQRGIMTNILKYKSGWRKFVLEQTLSYSDMLNYRNKIKLSHPYRQYPQLTLENTQTVQELLKTHKIMLSTDDSKYWKVTAEYKKEQGSSVAVMLDVEDHDGAIFLVEARHATKSDTITPSLHVTWRNDSKTDNVYLVGTWNGYQMAKRNGEIRFTSSLKDYEAMALRFDYDVESEAKSARIAFTRPDDNVISLSGKIDTFKKSGILTFASPFKKFEELILEGSYVYGSSMRGDVGFQWGPTKKTELTGTLMRTDNEGAVTVTFSSPFESYEKLIFSSNYDVSKDVKTMTTTLRYGPNKQITLTENGKITADSGYLKITFSSPFEKYSFISAETNFDVSQNKKTAHMKVEWPTYQKLYIDGEMNLQEDRKSARLTINTPIEALKSLVTTAMLDTSSQVVIGNVKSTWNTYNTMELSGNFQKQSDRMIKGMLTFTSPFKNFKNLKFDLNMENNSALYKGSTSFSWDNENRMSTEVTLKTNPFDIVIRADSPFEPVKDVLIKASCKHTKDLQVKASIEWMTAKKFSVTFLNEVENENEIKTSLVVRTPWNGYRNFDLRSTFMITKTSITVGFSAKTPFSSLPSLEISSTLLREGYDKINYAFKVVTDEPIVEVTFDYTVDGQREEAKYYVNIPYLYKKALTSDFTRNKNQRIINVNYGYNTYTFKYTLTNGIKRKQVSAELLIPTLEYKYRSMKLDGSLKLRDDNTVDAMLEVRNAVDTHKATVYCNVGHKYLRTQVDLTTPLLETGHVKLNGDFDCQTVKKVDMKITTPRTVYSIIGVFDKMTWNEFKGNVTFESPTEFFGNAHIGAFFKKQEMKSIEGSLNLETPIENLRSVKLSGNMHVKSGSIESMLSLEAPIPDYEKISLIAKVDHDREWKDVRSSLTLMIPRVQYSAFGEFADPYEHRTVKVGFSKNSQRLGELTVQVDKQKFAILAIFKRQTADYRMEQYKTQVMYRVEDDRLIIDGSVDMPDNERVTLNGQFFHQNWNNFDARVSITSSFANYETMSASVSRKSTRYNCKNEINASWSPKKVARLSFVRNKDRRGPTNAKLVIQTPWEVARDISSSLNYNTEGRKNTLDFDIKYTRKTFLEITSSCDKITKTLTIEVPKLGLKGSGMYKNRDKPELIFRIEIPSRIVFFRSVFQPNGKGFKHTTEFAWDQRKGKQGSYEVIYTDRSTRNVVQGDLVVRVIHSIRAIDVKFSHQLTNRDVILTSRFMWDPLRDTRKQMTVIVEGHDTSVYGKNSYNGIVTLKTPRLYNVSISEVNPPKHNKSGVNNWSGNPINMHGTSFLIVLHNK